MKISEIVLHICSEESLSQIFYIDPSFYFMLCITKHFENISKVF